MENSFQTRSMERNRVLQEPYSLLPGTDTCHRRYTITDVIAPMEKFTAITVLRNE